MGEVGAARLLGAVVAQPATVPTRPSSLPGRGLRCSVAFPPFPPRLLVSREADL